MTIKQAQPRDPERTRETLLKAAASIVTSKGIQAMTLEDVATAAAVSKGGLLHHFRNKSALLMGIAQDMIQRYDLEVAEYQAQDPTPPGAFTRAYLRANLKCSDECSQLCNALVSDMRAFPGPLNLFREHSRQCQQRLENDGIDPVTASIVRYAAEGLMAAAIWGMARPSQYERMVGALLEMAGAPQRGKQITKKNKNNKRKT